MRYRKEQKNYDWHTFKRNFHGKIRIVCDCILDKCSSVPLHETVQIKLILNREYNNYENIKTR